MLRRIFACAAPAQEGSGLAERGLPTREDLPNAEALDDLKELDRRYGCLVKMEDGTVDMRSELGYHACGEFLGFVESVGDTFKLEAAPRVYRTNFSASYRARFPAEIRSYRVDLLCASAGQCTTIWVNGAKFEFSAEAVRLATALQEAWSSFCMSLDHRAAVDRPANRDGVLEVCELLDALDHTWAAFECQYITELMEIEIRARATIVEAVGREQNLQRMELEASKLRTDIVEELYCGGVPNAGLVAEILEERRNLVTCIAQLNTVANFNRKGRDDIDAEVLESAIATLRECKADDAAAREGAEERNVASNLALDVIESFQAMREYFSVVKDLIHRVDPQLRHNHGLVARLEDFEETWEIGARYVADSDVRNEVCSLVAEVRSAARAVPALKEMLENCSVELFLCLPRIVWLRYLASTAKKRRDTGENARGKTLRGRNRGRAKTMPAGGTFGANDDGACGDGSGLVRAMLPKRFDSAIFSDGVHALVVKFEKASCCIQQTLHETEDQELATRLVFLRRATAGSGEETSDNYAESFKRGPGRAAAIAATEELMHDLEAYSMELQRHCAEDWNQCAAVLVQQLTECERKNRRSQFKV